MELFINVCREIGKPDKETSSCPIGSAACLRKDGKSYDVGRPKDALRSDSNERLVISYESDDKAVIPDFCNGHKPAVSITFTCPSVRTEGTSPKLTANSNCRYEIEWVTEYACHRDYLESGSCVLKSEQHDISIDLSLLRVSGDIAPYQASDSSGQYIYYLNVCGPVKAGPCKGENVSSCQVKKANMQSKGAGSFQNQTLRYSDGDLTLTYLGGEKCSSGFERMTVINFECNETAVNNGNGVPDFDAETDCTYFFTWETKYACFKEKEDLLCRVTDNRKRYDLSVLTRIAETDEAGVLNWEAVDANPAAVKNYFFINVCHKVLQQGNAKGCDVDAAICSVGSEEKKSLGKFLSPPVKVRDGIQLVYSGGSLCAKDKQIQTIITFVCKPGDLASPPVLKSSDTAGCLYEFEWHSAAACVMSKAEGDDCKVFDSQAGFSYDLSPLKKSSGGYHTSANHYNFEINVCENLSESKCADNAGACQVSESLENKWNLGISNSKLSYYDGIIQLHYTNGTPYQNKEKTPRSTLITFLCDREADVGQPKFQEEDQYTYNFKWYTKYACPALSVECAVVDENTSEQYDLSRLIKPEEQHVVNWYALDRKSSLPKKYYINICRPLVPVQGCDHFASVCQTEYNMQYGYEIATIKNLGIAHKRPVIITSGKLILEYVNGSECTNETGSKTTYTTRIHLLCSEGSLYSSPRFLSIENCVVTFVWNTEVACPVTIKNGTQNCSVKDPDSGFVFNLQSLMNDTGYSASGNGKMFKLNICGPLKDCGSVNDKEAAGCVYDGGAIHNQVQVDRSLQLSTEGFITLTYRGKLEAEQQDAFIIHFVCDDDYYPGELSFLREEINSATKLHDIHFEFKTALACVPAQVDCQVTDATGNEYDLSGLSRDGEPWVAVNLASGSKRTFYLNVCKPLPYIRGCQGGAVGSCMKWADNFLNLGFIQISPQASADGSLTIVYLNGDICHDKERYSTRIIFQCDHNIGSPVFQQQDGCEFVFLWRTPEACPVVRAEGDHCQVKDPKYGYLYNLKPLGEKDINVKAEDYVYTFKVCGAISKQVCTGAQNVSSCQVKDANHKVAGLFNQKLTFENGLISINYTDGELCHNIYKRSTVVLFICGHTDQQPYFLRETPDCSYMFQWPTPLACPPFKFIDCSYKDNEGNSYDLSSLSIHNENWKPILPGSTQKYRLNVCRSLVPEIGPASCKEGAAACLFEENKSINLGEIASSPRWEDGVSVLEYNNGDQCPDGIRNRTTTIRFKCDKSKTDSKPRVITVLENCDYQFLWITAAACPLNISMQDHCRVTNPTTGHLFDLSKLNKTEGYSINYYKKSIRLNICSGMRSECAPGVGVCISEGGRHLSAGNAQTQIKYMDQVLSLVYEDGDPCSKNNLKHRSVFNFVCGTDSSTDGSPTLVSFDETSCTWYFSWHTSIVCEEKTKCSVYNGTSLIDLSPLIKHSGNYETLDGTASGNLADFYINICEPLNSVDDVLCPPRAAVCIDPKKGKPLDIGRVNSPPYIDTATQKVMLTMDSPTQCVNDNKQNYSSVIIFHCAMGTDLGIPKLVEMANCKYIFEWRTPIVCPHEEIISACSLNDTQLHYTFNLSSLSKNSFKTTKTNSYYIGVCSAAMNVPGGKCKGSVCLVSGNDTYSFGSAEKMTMNYLHQEETLILQYKGGDSCPSESSKRESTILFKCDEQAGLGSPELLSETRQCSAMFEWKTQLVCVPKKMDCKFVLHHKTYDLRMLSSMTGSWNFVHDGNSYYINLCQNVNQGPPGCSSSASVCRKSQSGTVQILGQVHTQIVNVKDDAVYVKYSNGDACTNAKKLSTTIELKCSNTVGAPTFQRYDEDLCEYHFAWKTRAACGLSPKEVEMKNGIIHLDSGMLVSLTDIYFKSYNATGDIRPDGGDHYIYEVQLSGKSDSRYQKCKNASVCQIKINGTFTRAVGSVRNVKYYLNDDDLDVVFTSDSQCGKDRSKNTTATILFYCSHMVGEGHPEFFHETTDCQYLFTWYTSAVCPLVPQSEASSNSDQNYQGLSRRSQAVGAILSILLVVLVVCLVVLLLYKKERRESVIFKITNCCRRSSNVSYKYTKISSEEEADDNETEWLMEEVSSNQTKAHQENGHIRSMKPGNFTSLPVDDLDSEDEVLTIPEVRIQSARSKNKNADQSKKGYSTDKKLIGVQNGGQESSLKPKSGQHKKEDNLNIISFHDDSDEDMINV
ncbi:hypothetical protein GDO86_009380 [Hymenochirus boettgeri]|uniref:MRH domain-containing protein n=1 Tax=Hymenochirus boettgeri TaxID=247094 RepID=A0A8T2JL01_9PIPI|nr:hypothetical protein GDO86_009380 [Hymenochirus boettgeri]